MEKRCNIPKGNEKHIKKLISLILAFSVVFSLLIPVSTVNAETIHEILPNVVNVIEAEEISDKTENASAVKNAYRDYTSNNNKYPNSGCVAAKAGMNFKYNLNVKESGKYRLNLYLWAKGPKVYEISVNNEVALKSSFNTEETIVCENRAGEIELLEGENYLNIKAVSSNETYVFFYYLTLEKMVENSGFKKESGSFRDTYVPGIIQAEDFDIGESGSFGNVSEFPTSTYRDDSLVRILSPDVGRYTVTLSEGEFVNYTFKAETADYYTVSASCEMKSDILLYLDNSETPVNAVVQPGKNKESVLCTMYLTKGEHILRVEANGSDIAYDYLRISSGDATKNVISQNEDGIEAGTLNNVYKELYIAENGNDSSGDGSVKNPFKSIKRAKEEVAKINDNMTGDIVIYIMPGIYKLEETEVFTTDHGGKNGYNVIFKGANILNPPMISGGIEVTGWQKHTNEIWSAPLSGVEYARNLYVDGFPATRAKSKYIYQVIDHYNAPGSSYSKDGLVVSARNFPESFARPQDLELVFNDQWENHRVPVTGFIKRETDAVLLCHQEMVNFNSTTSKGYSFYMENAMELLDEPGEFYYNVEEGKIYYYPYKEEDMTKVETYVADTELLFNIKGDSKDDRIKNLIFDNLKIFYGAYNFASREGYVGTQADGLGNRDAVIYKDGAFYAGQITVNNADRFVIRNCEIACHGSAVINMEHGVSNSKIVGNVIRDASGGGIKIGSPLHYVEREGIDVCRNIDVENNVVQRVCAEFLNNCGITVYYEKDIDILHNVIKDLPYSGMSIGWGWQSGAGYDWGNFNISYNHIENIMQTLYDGGGIYTLGDLNGAVISNNYIKNHPRGHGGLIYHDAGSKNSEDFNNVLIETMYYLHVTGQQFDPKNINFHDNYSDTKNRSFGTYSDANNIKADEPTLLEKDNYPKEAQDIINNAGLEPHYKRLDVIAKMPSWRHNRVNYLLLNYYKSTDASAGITVEAEDFMPGGEGVGYHKILNPKFDSNLYRPEAEVRLEKPSTRTTYVVGTNTKDEWLKYELNLETSGDYFIELEGKQTWTEFSICKIYIDDVMVTENVPLQNINEWKTITVGPFEMSEGRHEVKIEFLSSFYFDKLFFYTKEMLTQAAVLGNEEGYDEGVIVPYRE